MLNEPTTKGLLHDIMAMRNYAKQLLSKGKEYDVLLRYLTDKNYWWDDDIETPNIKTVLKATSLSHSKLKRLTKKLHKDLLNDEENEISYNFIEVEYYFTLSYYDNRASFSVKKIPVVPRVGEQIEVPYFRNYVGSTLFHVSSIKHEFLDGKQLVFIKLKSGQYNKFWHIRKDEAKIKGEIHWQEFYKLSDFDLKEMLNLDSTA